MRFKYYLKGLGMGIIVTTLIMTISCVLHDNKLSDEEIMEKAAALGMILPESEKDSAESKPKETQTQDTKPEEPKETEPKETESEEPKETESEEPKETESEEPSTEVPPQHTETIQYVLHIKNGDTPRKIANELYENGMVDSATKFRSYIADHGYAGKIRIGTYTITKGMSYEEIAKIITRS